MAGSLFAIIDVIANITSQQRYLPFGQVRTDVSSPNPQSNYTDFAYTGQRAVSGLGLMDYHARMYDNLIGRFIQPDDIVPDFNNPQSLNRYSYVFNRPVILNDPTGHCPICLVAVLMVGVVLLTGDTSRSRPGNAENVMDLIAAGLQHDTHANIVGGGLQSLQADPSVKDAQTRVLNRLTDNPEYGEQAYSVNKAISAPFTANGPTRNWVVGLLSGNQATWMVHGGSISATNTKVYADGTVSTMWHIHDDFDFIPNPNRSAVYNDFAIPVHFIYNKLLHAEESYPTDAYWKQTIPPPAYSCGHCN